MGRFRVWFENEQKQMQDVKDLWNQTTKILTGGLDVKTSLNKPLSDLVRGDHSDPKVTYRGPNAVIEMLGPIFDRMRQSGQDGQGDDLASNADLTKRWLSQSGQDKEGHNVPRPLALSDLLKKMFGEKLFNQFTGTDPLEPKEDDGAKPEVPPQPPANNEPPPEQPQPPPEDPNQAQPPQPPQSTGIPQPQNPMANAQMQPPQQMAHYRPQGGVFAEWKNRRSKSR